MQKIQGWVEQGNTTLTITGGSGTIARKVQGSFPSATVTVFITSPPPVSIQSISRTSNVVTVVMPAGTNYIVGNLVTIAGVTDATYNGTFTIASIVGSTFTYSQIDPNSTSSGGTAQSIQLANIYADNNLTAKANPFTAGNDGTWFFYAPNGSYDVQFSGGGIAAPFTIGALGVTSQIIVNVRDFGALGNGVADDTAAIQSAINFAGANAMVYFPAGQYKVTSQLSVVNNAVYLVGFGQRSTTILFAPTANGTCWKISTNPVTGDLAQGGIFSMAIYSSDSTFHKTAINIVAVTNYTIRDVFVWGAVGGTYWSDSTNGSIALQTNGHELTTISNFYTFSDQPIVIGPNPISALSCDVFNFVDCTLAAQNNPVVFVQDNVGLTNVSFTGRQSWSGGTNGFKWINTIGQASYYALSFENVRWEQVQGSGGWSVFISFYKAPVAISSVTRTGGATCTATVPANAGFIPGGGVTVTGVTDPTFDGAGLPVVSYSGTTLVYTANGTNATSSGGTATPLGGGNLRGLVMTNCSWVNGGGPVNGFYFREVTAVTMTNVEYLGSSIALDVDQSCSSFSFWNTLLGLAGATINLSVPAFNDFIIYTRESPGGILNRFSIGTFNQGNLINIPYGAAYGAVNKTGVGKTLIGIGLINPGVDNMIAIDPAGTGLTTGGALRIGGYTGPVSGTTGIFLPNAQPLSGVNNSGTGSFPMIEVDATNAIVLGPGGGGVTFGGSVKFGATIIPNGAVSVCTLGTTGGAGPTTAAQNGWMQFSDSAGTTFWVPVWR